MKSVMQLQPVPYPILTMKSYTFEGYNQCLGSYLIFKNKFPFPFLKNLEITVGNQRNSKFFFFKSWIIKTSRVERLVIVLRGHFAISFGVGWVSSLKMDCRYFMGASIAV